MTESLNRLSRGENMWRGLMPRLESTSGNGLTEEGILKLYKSFKVIINKPTWDNGTPAVLRTAFLRDFPVRFRASAFFKNERTD